MCKFVLRGDRVWGFRQKGKRQEADNEPDFVHMIGQRPRDYGGLWLLRNYVESWIMAYSSKLGVRKNWWGTVLIQKGI